MTSTMRSILCLLLLSLPGFAPAQGSPDILVEKPLQTTIEVEISNAPEAVTQVYLTYRDLITYKKEKIFPQGGNEQKLRFEFQKYNVQDIQLVINDQTLTLLVVPGEQISLKCSVTAEGLQPIFSGASVSFQSTYHKLFNALQDLDVLHEKALEEHKDLEPAHYQQLIEDQKAAKLGVLAKWSQTQEAPKYIMSWFQNFIKYRAANAQFRFGWKHRKEIADQAYWDFFPQNIIQKLDPLSCTELYTFYFNYLVYLSSIEHLFTDELKSYGHNWSQFYNSYIRKLKSGITGIGTDILVTHFIYAFSKDDLANFTKEKKELLSYVAHPLLRKNADRRLTEVVQQAEKLSSLEGINIYDYRQDTLTTTLFEHLLQQYKGQVIYIDNWATWCGPCIAEMPHSNRLQEELKDENVVFVFLCSQDNFNNDRAKVIIAENQLKGEHYFMNFPQSASIESKFSSRGIPRYMIVDQQGKIIDNDAPRPSAEACKEKILELVKVNTMKND